MPLSYYSTPRRISLLQIVLPILRKLIPKYVKTVPSYIVRGLRWLVWTL